MYVTTERPFYSNYNFIVFYNKILTTQLNLRIECKLTQYEAARPYPRAINNKQSSPQSHRRSFFNIHRKQNKTQAVSCSFVFDSRIKSEI